MTKNEYNVLGVMSGTSLDGIDFAYVSFKYSNAWSYEIKNVETYSYTKYWREILSTLLEKDSEELKNIDKEYTLYLAQEINSFIKINKLTNIDFIASHGHTALHQPEKRLTYQIGNRSELATLTAESVVCDFRVQDVSLGGQGAPLVPIGDRLLFYEYDYCLNLGGFANISYEYKNERIAYDICPVNSVLNYFTTKIDKAYDDRGKLAASGKILKRTLNQLNNLDYYNEIPPKSLGIEWVYENILPILKGYETKDILRTFVEHAAIQISRVLSNAEQKVLVTGGGTYNDFLISRIQEHSKSKLIIPKKEIIEFKEALIFGFLGVLKIRNEINCLKSVTGAKKDHSSGVIFEP